MQAYWLVLWSDLKAAGWFIAAAVGLALLASAMGTLLGSHGRQRGWRAIIRSSCAGATIGIGVGIGLAMLLEFAFEIEQIGSRRHLREHVGRALAATASIVALAAGFVHARRSLAKSDSSPSARRRTFTLRQLFAIQLAIAVLLGWWAFTRRDEISQRRAELVWQARDRADREYFAPYGWTIDSSLDHDWLYVYPHDLLATRRPAQQPVSDHALDIVVGHERVRLLMIVSDQVTDDGLHRLSKSSSIQYLTICSNGVTDEGLRHLTENPRLVQVNIRSNQITGAGLRHLTEIKSLRGVLFDAERVTADDVAEFRKARPDIRVTVQPLWR